MYVDNLDPVTGRRSGFDLSGLTRLTDLTVSDLSPESFDSTKPAVLPLLRDMLESWDAPPRFPLPLALDKARLVGPRK